MNTTPARVARGHSSAVLWFALWASLALLFATMAFDGVLRQVPWVVWVLWYLPLLVFVPGMLRDRLRSMAWLSFVSLMYFVAAVQRIFAEPASSRAQLELLAVIALFLATMFYLRARGRELRALREANAAEGPPGPGVTRSESERVVEVAVEPVSRQGGGA